MKSRHVLFGIAALCFGFLVVALYMQHIQGIQTCPLCVLQRYAFIVLGLCCFVGAYFNVLRLGAISGFVAALSGAGIAAWQVWNNLKADLGCGYDPLEGMVNGLITAKWLPFLFHANGSCGDDKFRLFWLTVPQWSLIWFCLFTIVLLWVMFRRSRQ